MLFVNVSCTLQYFDVISSASCSLNSSTFCAKLEEFPIRIEVNSELTTGKLKSPESDVICCALFSSEVFARIFAPRCQFFFHSCKLVSSQKVYLELINKVSVTIPFDLKVSSNMEYFPSTFHTVLTSIHCLVQS